MIGDRKIIVIAGPTASGKTEAALRFAEVLKNAEIINADSVQLYKDLPILTARPNSSELLRAKHHLFGYLDAMRDFSVADWLDDATKIIDNLHNENKIAIICGGTGFYIDALLNGIANIPDVPKYHREEVSTLFKKIGRENFFNKLKELDPDICKILHPNNTHRILRAFEVVTFTGKSLAYWWNTNQTKKYDATSIVINPDRKILHQRILSRVHFMLENGAIDEVADFQKEFPNYSGSLTKVIGKNEIASFLNNEISRDQLIDQMFIKTRQYAKRQSTWFRNKMSAAEFIDDHRDIEKILSEICK